MAKSGNGKTGAWVSPAEFARVAGLSREGVYGLIRSGRIPPHLVRKEGKYQSILQAEALAEIRGHGIEGGPMPGLDDDDDGDDRPDVRPWSRQEIPPIDESNAAERYWKARRAELDYRRAAGDLVEASDIESAYANEVAACRTKLLAIVSRIRQRVSLGEDAYSLIEDLIREALEELGKGAQAGVGPDDDDDSI